MVTQSDPTVATPRELALSIHTRRRGFLARALGLGAGAAALAATDRGAEAQIAPVPGITDVDILNFALNLEYLGSEFYTYGVTGAGIAAAGFPTTGSGTLGATIAPANPQVTFATPMLRQFFTELMKDEQAHLLTFRAGVASLGGTPVAKPAIDLVNSYAALAMMSPLIPANFNPYANETNFLLGAYILEDTCVTAVHGAAPLIVNKTILNTAAGLLGVEAYQAGAIRTLLNQRGQGALTQAISTIRATLSGVADFGVNQGPLNTAPGSSSIVLADPNALAFARTFRQILNIVYLAPNAAAGGFYPAGFNGTITH